MKRGAVHVTPLTVDRSTRPAINYIEKNRLPRIGRVRLLFIPSSQEPVEPVSRNRYGREETMGAMENRSGGEEMKTPRTVRGGTEDNCVK